MPAAGQQAAIERAVRRFQIGVEGGIALDPELIVLGAHGSFGPLFTPNLRFRPGLEMGFGEVTTSLALNFDFVFTLTEDQPQRWRPYFGFGPNFGFSNRSFAEEGEITVEDPDAPDGETETESTSRFDFSETDGEAGLNIIVGARRANGLFMEMRANAYGIGNIKLLVGFDF